MSEFDEKAEQQSGQFDLDVVEYEIEGEFSSLEAHIFVIEVWLQQEPYRIRRSYKDICEFDVHLNKQYPKTMLPPCPLSSSGSGMVQKGGIRGSLVSLKNNARESISIVSRRGSMNEINPDELVSQKKPALVAYLKKLLNIPEIVRSTNMLNFLDMASMNGDSYDDINVDLMNMLLEGTPEKSVNIVKKHSVKFNVEAGEYVVWKFSTKKRDLGFSINLNDDNILTYQRYNCHEKAIENVIKCPVSGTVNLLWDNTYSKLRTKHLWYRCKVLPNHEYKEYSKKCIDLSREQQNNQSKRSMLQRELVRMSHQLLSCQSGRLISQDFTVDMASGENMMHEDLQSEIAQLRNEKTSLQMALSESEIACADIRQELAAVKKSLERSNTVDEDLQRVTAERDELQQEILEESMAKKKLEIDANSALAELTSLREKYDTQANQMQADLHTLSTLQHQHTLLRDENASLVAELAQSKTTEKSGSSVDNDTQIQIQRLKGEKKQLKAYAISLKGQLEKLESEKDKESPLSEPTYSTVVSLIKKMTPLLAALETDLRTIQGLKNEYSSVVGDSNQNSSQELLEKTNKVIESGKNTTDDVSMMLEYADMKLAAIDTTQPLAQSHSGKQLTNPTVPEHNGSVFAPMVPSPTSSTSSSPTKSPQRSSKNNAHPPTCNCMKCSAPPKRPSMIETMRNTFLED